MTPDDAGRRHSLVRRPGLALAALCLAALILSLDITIVNVALPDLVRQIGATATDLQWVVDAYNLVFAALVLVAGSLSDRMGRKGMLLAGLGVFGAASLLGSSAHSAGELIGARAVMGLGAAMMFPSTLSLITSLFTERRERARGIGLWGASAGVGIAVGPIVGGWLLEQFWWGSIFVFMAPAAAVVMAGVATAVPTSRDPGTPPTDWRGLTLSAAGMGLLVFGVIQAPDWGWGSAAAIAAMAGGGGVLAGLIATERASAHPMIDIRLFRNPRFTAASGAVAIALFALLGFIFVMTQYFQVVKAFSPLNAGVRLLPAAVAVALASVAGTRLALRIGNKLVVSSGLALFGVALLWTARDVQATSFAVIGLQEVVLGAGLGLTQAPAAESILGAVPAEQSGVASAVNAATRLFGGTLGVAVIGSISASLYASRLLTTLPPRLPAGLVATAKGSVGGASVAARALSSAGLHTVARELDRAAVQAFEHSIRYACPVASGVALGGLLMVAFLLPGRPHADDSEPGTASAEIAGVTR